jgi:hypothetical protein
MMRPKRASSDDQRLIDCESGWLLCSLSLVAGWVVGVFTKQASLALIVRSAVCVCVRVCVCVCGVCNTVRTFVPRGPDWATGLRWLFACFVFVVGGLRSGENPERSFHSLQHSNPVFYSKNRMKYCVT